MRSIYFFNPTPRSVLHFPIRYNAYIIIIFCFCVFPCAITRVFIIAWIYRYTPLISWIIILSRLVCHLIYLEIIVELLVNISYLHTEAIKRTCNCVEFAFDRLSIANISPPQLLVNKIFRLLNSRTP